MQDSAKLVSIVLGSYNRLKYLKLALATIRAEMESSGITYEIIVVDGGSNDGSMAWLSKQKDVITIIQHNRGEWRGRPIARRSWGYFMNLAFKLAQGKYICMVSDDCLIVPGAIRNGIRLFDKELQAKRKVGAVAFYWRNWPELGEYWVGLTFGNKIFVNHGLYLRSALLEVGFIDEDGYTFYHADGDLCMKLWQQGYACIDSPESFIEHHGDANFRVRHSNLERQQIDWNTYQARWQTKFGNQQAQRLEKDYQDPSGTWKLFGDPRLEFLRRKIARGGHRLLENISNWRHRHHI